MRCLLSSHLNQVQKDCVSVFFPGSLRTSLSHTPPSWHPCPSPRILDKHTHSFISMSPALVTETSNSGLSKCREAHMTGSPEGRLFGACAPSQARSQGLGLLQTAGPNTLRYSFQPFLQEGYSTSLRCFCDPGRKKGGRMRQTVRPFESSLLSGK